MKRVKQFNYVLILLTGILIGCSLGLSAQSIYLNFNDGTTNSYHISQIRNITFTGALMKLNKNDGSTVSWNISTIRNYTYTQFITGIRESSATFNGLFIYPNPANSFINIDYDLQNVDNVTIEIFDLQGRVIKRLLKETQYSGNKNIKWDALDENGNHLAKGVYLCSISTDHQTITKPLIIQ